MSAESAFWYTPHPITGIIPTQRIDIGEIISDLQIDPFRISHDAVSWSGRRSRINMRSGLKVRIINERFTDTALAEDLFNMADHLERGLPVAFAVKKSKTFCGFSVGPADTSFGGTSRKQYDITVGPLFTAFSGASPAVGDVLLAQSFGADSKREECRVSSYDATTKRLVLQDSLKFNHVGLIMFRHRDFFPALFRPASTNETTLLTHDHRITYTFDAVLEEFPAHILALSEQDEQMVSTNGVNSVFDDLFGGGILTDDMLTGGSSSGPTKPSGSFSTGGGVIK
mgnify:CR=1 FL=1